MKSLRTGVSLHPAKLTESQPKLAFCTGNLAILHYDAERYQEALDDLDRAIALSPDTPDLYQNRAVALTVLGRLEEAAQDLKTYLKLNPDAETTQ